MNEYELSHDEEEKIKSLEPLLKLILSDIGSLRLNWKKLKKEYPEVFNGSKYTLSVQDDWEFWKTEEILEQMEDDIKEILLEEEEYVFNEERRNGVNELAKIWKSIYGSKSD